MGIRKEELETILRNNFGHVSRIDHQHLYGCRDKTLIPRAESRGNSN